MGNGFGKCTNIEADQQLIIDSCAHRSLVDGPAVCVCYPIWSKGSIVQCQALRLNEYMFVENSMQPQKHRQIYGPELVRLTDPYEVMSARMQCPVLDQDDYLIRIDSSGNKVTLRGPLVVKPQFGDQLGASQNAIVVPVNQYIIVQDSNDSDAPIKNMRGPLKFIPQPFQSICKIPVAKGGVPTGPEAFLYKCDEVNQLTALHVKRRDGRIDLVDKPQFFMPEVGEEVIKRIARIVMIESDFCILKGPDGVVHIKDGKQQDNRSFFLQPFYEFLEFDVGAKKQSILSKLPTFISHQFVIRTSDNVLLELDLRISYQILDPSVFGMNPIPFQSHIVNWAQNELLDMFAKVDLRQFMKAYSSMAIQSIKSGTDYFSNFGISILDIQVINYKCQDPRTQELLNEDIKLNVTKQNELKAKEQDILIREKENEIKKRQKDLDMQMMQKDREMGMKDKELEVQLRLKELELQVSEEKKRTELLMVKRDNAVKEGEFEGKAQGMAVEAFFASLGSIPLENKMAIWMTMRDLDKSSMLYSRVTGINMYPPTADMKFFNLEGGHGITGKELTGAFVLPEIMGYNGSTRGGAAKK